MRSAGAGIALTFLLAPTTTASAQHDTSAFELPDHYLGAYRTPSGGTLSLARFGHGDRVGYLFTDYADGWRGSLQRIGRDTFAIVSQQGRAPAEPASLVVVGNSAGPSLRLLLPGDTIRTAFRLDVRNQQVQFNQGSVRLAGEVVLPPGPGPHPGVVFVHGSGPATRNDYREWSYFFAANGIAVLIYDKRGAGESSGDYRQATFHDLAADAAAGARFLRSRPEVDPRRVGMSGGSQGAWVAPIAAGLDSMLAFLIPTGGGPVTPATQEIYRRARIVSDSGFSAPIVETARTVVTTYFDYLGSGGRDSALAARVSAAWKQYGSESWFTLLDLPPRDPTVGEWPEGRKRFASELHFDAAPYVRALRIPTLAILGAEDQGFPVPETVRAWREASPAEHLTLLVIPNVDHGFWVTSDPRRPRHQAPALFERMLAWIRGVVQAPPVPSPLRSSPTADSRTRSG